MRKTILILSLIVSMTFATEKSEAFGAFNTIEYICLSASNGVEIFSGSAPADAVPRLTAVCSAAGGRLLAGFPL